MQISKKDNNDSFQFPLLRRRDHDVKRLLRNGEALKIKRTKPNAEPMKLEKIFNMQSRRQNKLGLNVKRQEYLNTMVLALYVELGEFIQETNWKPWRKSKINEDKAKIKEELIDVWHFLINFSLARGMDAEEVYNSFVKKGKIAEEAKQGNKELMKLWRSVMNLSIAVGMSAEEVHAVFSKKSKVNGQRVKHGY